MGTYMANSPYRIDHNGVSYQYCFKENEETDYTYIKVPKNPRRTDEAPYRVLMLSDSHIGAEHGTWATETRYRFHSGKKLAAWWRTAFVFPTDTEILFHVKTTVDINGAIHIYAVGERALIPANARICFLTNMLISIPDGTEVIFPNGIMPWDRCLLLTDRILYEWDRHPFDCVFLLGDIVSNEENKWKDAEDFDYHYWKLFKDRYLCRLEEAGIPYFLVYGNHDDLNEKQFRRLFPYSRNYMVEIGDALFLCFDVFETPDRSLKSFGLGVAYGDERMLIDTEFLSVAEKTAENKKAVYLLSHFFPTELSAGMDFIKQTKNALAGFEGHSHYRHTRHFEVDGDRFSFYADGNFSLEADEWGLAGKDEVTEYGYSAGSWSFLCLDGYSEENGLAAQAYYIFPEIPYGVMHASGGRCRGKCFPAFVQPRYATDAEAFPSERHIMIKKRGDQ